MLVSINYCIRSDSLHCGT